MGEWIRAIKRGADRFVFLLFRSLFRRNENAARTVAIIRTDGIGDLVFFLPYFKELKKSFADHRFVLVCRSESVPLAAPGLFDNVIPYQYRQYRWNYFYRLWVLAKVRSAAPSLTLYMSYHRQHVGDEIAIFSGAQRVVAFEGNDEIIHPSMKAKNNRHYSTLVHAKDHSPESAKYSAFFESLGVTVPTRTVPGETLLAISGKEQGGVEPYVLLAPGGSSSLRRWPPERFAELGDRLAGLTGYRVVLCGNRAEKGLLVDIAARMEKAAQIESGLSIPEVVGLIKRAKIAVGNESGLLHIAASVGTPAIVILGGGHFSRYFPYGSARVVNHKLDCYECNWKCPFPEPYCLTRITVDEVVRVVGSLVRSDG